MASKYYDNPTTIPLNYTIQVLFYEWIGITNQQGEMINST